VYLIKQETKELQDGRSQSQGKPKVLNSALRLNDELNASKLVDVSFVTSHPHID
jgi:hypothetical protein